LNDLRTAAYTEYKFELDGEEYAFYASFSLELKCLVYNVVRNGFEIKLIADISVPVLLKYSAFIEAHEKWAAGLTERPEFHD
jgi:hypothetical protein